MASFMKWVKWGAVVYTGICIIQSFFLSFGFLGILDNLFFIFGLVYLVDFWRKNREFDLLMLSFLLFFGWSVFSQLIVDPSQLFSNLSYSLMFLKWPIILVTIYGLTTGGHEVSLRYFLNSLFLVLVGLNLFMAWNPYQLGELIQNVYSNSPYTDFVYYNQFDAYRLAGTQKNPNDNALIWGCFLIYYGAYIRKYWSYFFLALGLLLLTQSRTIFVLIVLIAGMLMVKRLFLKRDLKTLLIVLILGASTGLIGFFASKNLRSIFNGDAFVSNSLLTRYQHYEELDQLDGSVLWIGRGVVTNPLESVGFYFDSEFLAVIMQFGLIGLVLWGFLVVSLWRTGTITNSQVYLYVFLIIGASATNFVLLHPSIGVVVSLFLGLGIQRNKLDLLNQKIERLNR